MSSRSSTKFDRKKLQRLYVIIGLHENPDFVQYRDVTDTKTDRRADKIMITIACLALRTLARKNECTKNKFDPTQPVGAKTRSESLRKIDL